MENIVENIVGWIKGLGAFGIVAQIVGFVGLTLYVITFQFKEYKKLIFFKTTSEAIFGVHYLMLGAVTGGFSNFVGATRNVIFAILVSKKKSTLPAQIVFAVIFVIIGILTWQGPLSLLVITAKMITTAAYGISNSKTIRRLALPVSLCWIIYNGISRSIGGVIAEIFGITSVITAMIRLDMKKKD